MIFSYVAIDAISFWIGNIKYEFIKCHQRLLDQHEISDHTSHLIW